MDVVLVQEYAEGGDLYRLLHRNGGRLSERQAVEMVLHPFLLALHYQHTRGIMHRDVKVRGVCYGQERVWGWREEGGRAVDVMPPPFLLELLCIQRSGHEAGVEGKSFSNDS